MTGPLEIRVYENQQLVYAAELPGPVELGRQGAGEEAPYNRRTEAGRWRVVIAHADENAISRKHALLEPLPGGKVRFTNLSAKRSIRLADGTDLPPGTSCEVAVPALLTFGAKAVRVRAADTADVPLQNLPEATRRPGDLYATPSRLGTFALPSAAIDMEAVVRWLQATMGVLQSAAGDADFFPKAAQAIVDLVHLDSGRVLLWDQGDWKPEAVRTACGGDAEPSRQPSRQVLSRVRQEKRTFWQAPGAAGLSAGSMIGVHAVVAAPILDRHGEVIGALYGDRSRPALAAPTPAISRLEAILVELLASGVAAGLARLEQERAAVAARVRFEQFFTPELARHLAAHPDLLKGRDAEVTLLFADVRGFSRISERLGPAATVEWISDVMNALSECVLDHRGVLVDYFGDELLAMWGAPEEQPDHAQLACRAAVAMLGRLPGLNDRWRAVLQTPTALGIGLNTGIARVGNTGSPQKPKYGPLGNAANLASRVQGATKYFRTRLLVTGSTQAQLDASFQTRRLCKVRAVNISEPVDLHEVMPADQPGDLARDYERALAAFEAKDFRQAVSILGKLVAEYPDDGPSRVLMSRVLMGEDALDFDPVWELPGK